MRAYTETDDEDEYQVKEASRECPGGGKDTGVNLWEWTSAGPTERETK